MCRLDGAHSLTSLPTKLDSAGTTGYPKPENHMTARLHRSGPTRKAHYYQNTMSEQRCDLFGDDEACADGYRAG